MLGLIRRVSPGEQTDVLVRRAGEEPLGEVVLLARDLGMSASVQRLFVGHMGCYAALPGLGAVGDFTSSRGRPSVLLCLELPSLHAQPATSTTTDSRASEDDVQQMVAHALFSDAAAAVVLQPGGPGVELVDGRTDEGLELVEKEHTLMRFAQEPTPIAIGSGERTLAMTKQLTFDEC